MSKLPAPSCRRKPGRIENAPAWDRPDVPPPSPWLARKPEPVPYPKSGYIPGRLEQLLDEDPPMCAVKVWRYLDSKGRWRGASGQWNRCVWDATRTIARATGLSESAVRTVALPWLAAHGWIDREKVTIDGEEKMVAWCLWLLPIDLASEELPLGHGCKLRSLATPPDEGPPAAFFSPEGAGNSPESAEACAHHPAPDYRESAAKTTDDVSSSSEAAPPGREDPDPPAPPAIPARISSLLDQVLPESLAGERPALEAALPAMTSRANEIEWVMKAIILAIAAARKGRIKTSLACYAGGILDNFAREGGPAPSIKLPPPPPLARSPEEVAAAEKAKAEAKAEADKLKAREASLRARWEALSEAEREEIRAAVKADHPGLGRWKNMLEPLCLAALEARAEARPITARENAP